MDGGDRFLRERRLDEFASLPRDAEVAAEECLRRRGPQADEHARLQNGDLGVKPWAAGADLLPVRLLVDASLALGLPLEVLTTFVT